MTSDEVKRDILKAGGLQTLVDLCVGDHDNSQVSTMATKTLTMLGFIDCMLPVHIWCDGTMATVTVHQKPYHCDLPGLNVTVWDTLSSQEAIYQNFSLEQESRPPTPDLDIRIPCLTEPDGRHAGNLVFLTVWGCHTHAYLRGLRGTLLLGDWTTYGGEATPQGMSSILGGEEVPAEQDGLFFVVASTLTDSGRLHVVQVTESRTPLELHLSFAYRDIVNQRVGSLVLRPVLDLLLERPTPAPVHSPHISKVAELEILEVISRHSVHLKILMDQDHLLDYLAAFIWYCSEKGLESLRSQPLAMAHGLAALKVLTSLAIHDCYREQILTSDLVAAVVTLLSNLTSIWIKSCHHEAPLSPSTNDDSHPDDLLSAMKPSIGVSSPRSGNTPRPNQARGDRPSSSASTQFDSEYDQMYASLAKYCILFLANFTCSTDPDVEELARVLMTQSGAVQVLCSALLCCPAPLKHCIQMQLVGTISRTAIPKLIPPPRHSAVLSYQSASPAIQLSSDLLEVRNDSWTFESIRCTTGIRPAVEEDFASQQLLGWYYEVQLRSNGIIQIGWTNENSTFEPEKGMGIGDNVNSYAFDGARCKKWNGPITEQLNNDYGTEWNEGDTVSCLMHADGRLDFWLAGVDLGTAFTGVDCKSSWFPACSLSTEQQARFNFGTKPFRYRMPPGFVSIQQSLSQSQMGVGDFVEESFTINSVAWWVPLSPHLTAPSTVSWDDMAADHRSLSCDLHQPIDFREEGGGEQMSSEPSGSPGGDLIPAWYFEVNVTENVQRPFALGLSSTDKKQYVCTVLQEDGTLLMPDQTQRKCDELIGPTVGCGLLLPSSLVFFTLNGQPIKKFFAFENGDHKVTPELQPLLPFLSSSYVDLNLGNTFFEYEAANYDGGLLNMATLLHNYYNRNLPL